MDRSPEVLYALTKRFNAQKTKWAGKNWTYSPFSTNGMANASQAANTVGISVARDGKKDGNKYSKRTFIMTLKKSGKNGIKKTKKNSQGNPAVTVESIGRDPHHAAKIIKKQIFLSDNDKNIALRKLYALARSTRA